MKKLFLVSLLFVITLRCLAQNDSLRTVHEKSDTVELKSYATRYDPRKALLFAAVLPGLGQVYTKKYWKLPLVYGGLAGVGYGLNFYQTGYTKYRGELYDVLETGALRSSSGFTKDQLRTIVNRYRRERDFMIIVMAGVYILQIIDAHVDAHLKEFDVNPNLQVRLEPSYSNEVMTGRMGGIALVLRF